MTGGGGPTNMYEDTKTVLLYIKDDFTIPDSPFDSDNPTPKRKCCVTNLSAFFIYVFVTLKHVYCIFCYFYIFNTTAFSLLFPFDVY